MLFLLMKKYLALVVIIVVFVALYLYSSFNLRPLNSLCKQVPESYGGCKRLITGGAYFDQKEHICKEASGGCDVRNVPFKSIDECQKVCK